MQVSNQHTGTLHCWAVYVRLAWTLGGIFVEVKVFGRVMIAG